MTLLLDFFESKTMIKNTWPDLTLLFDIKPEEGLKRIASNANREVNRLDLEKLDFHHKVRDTFLELQNATQKDL